MLCYCFRMLLLFDHAPVCRHQVRVSHGHLYFLSSRFELELNQNTLFPGQFRLHAGCLAGSEHEHSRPSSLSIVRE